MLKFLIVFSLLALHSPMTFAHPDPWQELRRGGHVILMRHANTDGLTPSIDPDSDFDGCAAQRNLSLQGRSDAAHIGRTLRAKRIPIAAVLAGPSCRTQDTARLAFKKYKVWEALDLLSDFSETDAAQRTEKVSEKIAAYRGRKNWVLVTHQQNIDALIFDLVDPGTLVVLKPEGKNFRVLGKLPVNDSRLRR